MAYRSMYIKKNRMFHDVLIDGFKMEFRSIQWHEVGDELTITFTAYMPVSMPEDLRKKAIRQMITEVIN